MCCSYGSTNGCIRCESAGGDTLPAEIIELTDLTDLRYAYNTNGCAHHRLDDAIELIARAGYDGVALTLDWHHLDPLADDYRRRARSLRKELQARKLAVVIETGARYLLNPAQKHEPTLINPHAEGRLRRLNFLKRAVDIAGILEAETVSFWSGIKQERVPGNAAWVYLREGLAEVVAYAEREGVHLSLEPEPGMLVETNQDFERLTADDPRFASLPALALDLGHVWVTGESDPVEAIRKYRDRLGTVSIEGMRRGVHQHLPLHEGDMPIAPLLAALRDIDYRRLVCVELSRESPRAHEAIPQSISFLRRAEAGNLDQSSR